MFNKAREWGYTSSPNPCAGVKGLSERGGDVYVEDETYKSAWDAADWPTRDGMDVAYSSGQRPADVLKLRLADIRDSALWITQGKIRSSTSSPRTSKCSSSSRIATRNSGLFWSTSSSSTRRGSSPCSITTERPSPRVSSAMKSPRRWRC